MDETIVNPLTSRKIKISGETAKKIYKMHMSHELRLSSQDADKCKAFFSEKVEKTKPVKTSSSSQVNDLHFFDTTNQINTNFNKVLKNMDTNFTPNTSKYPHQLSKFIKYTHVEHDTKEFHDLMYVDLSILRKHLENLQGKEDPNGMTFSDKLKERLEHNYNNKYEQRNGWMFKPNSTTFKIIDVICKGFNNKYSTRALTNEFPNLSDSDILRINNNVNKYKNWSQSYVDISHGSISKFYQVFLTRYSPDLRKVEDLYKIKFDPIYDAFVDTFNYVVKDKQARPYEITSDKRVSVSDVIFKYNIAIFKKLQYAVKEMMKYHDNSLMNHTRFVLAYFTNTIKMSNKSINGDHFNGVGYDGKDDGDGDGDADNKEDDYFELLQSINGDLYNILASLEVYIGAPHTIDTFKHAFGTINELSIPVHYENGNMSHNLRAWQLYFVHVDKAFETDRVKLVKEYNKFVVQHIKERKIVKTYLSDVKCNDGKIRKSFRLKGRGNTVYVMYKKKITVKNHIPQKEN